MHAMRCDESSVFHAEPGAPWQHSMAGKVVSPVCGKGLKWDVKGSDKNERDSTDFMKWLFMKRPGSSAAACTLSKGACPWPRKVNGQLQLMPGTQWADGPGLMPEAGRREGRGRTDGRTAGRPEEYAGRCAAWAGRFEPATATTAHMLRAVRAWAAQGYVAGGGGGGG